VALARELHVSRQATFYRWRDELDPRIPGMEMSGKTRAFTLRKEVNHLKRVLAEKKFSLALKHDRRSARA
jgi:hypothetical protein